jgi:hypothetical protein
LTDNLASTKNKVEWDKPMEKGEKIIVNQYMQSIAKDVSSMHKVLNQILPKQTIELIFSEVFRFMA